MLHTEDEAFAIANTVKEGVINGIYEGNGFGEFHIDAIDTNQLASESLRRRAKWLARPVSDWVRVTRSTFFPEDEENGFIQKILSADRFIPRLTEAARHIQTGIRLAGDDLKIGPLSGYSINRIGINYMYGNHKKVSEIPAHVDVETERGAVVVVRLSEGPSTRITNNNTQVIFSKDVCDITGIPQYEHSVATKLKRVSATLADLRP